MAQYGAEGAVAAVAGDSGSGCLLAWQVAPARVHTGAQTVALAALPRSFASCIAFWSRLHSALVASSARLAVRPLGRMAAEPLGVGLEPRESGGATRVVREWGAGVHCTAPSEWDVGVRPRGVWWSEGRPSLEGHASDEDPSDADACHAPTASLSMPIC